ncbi:MAG: hypothetical protein ABIZ80_08285 [Bryobacteraceae bacterium]
MEAAPAPPAPVPPAAVANGRPLPPAAQPVYEDDLDIAAYQRQGKLLKRSYNLRPVLRGYDKACLTQSN